MNKDEFLRALQGRLSETLSRDAVEENIRYYDSYIAERVRQGMDEREVIEQLGDPLLIAKTIMETSGDGSPEGARQVIYDAQEDTEESGYEESWRSRNPQIRHFEVRTRMGCLLTALVFAIVVGLILFFVGSVVSFLLPVLIPVFVVLLVLGYLKERMR